MMILRITLLLAVLSSVAAADQVRVEDIKLQGSGDDQRVHFTLSWKNAFRDKRGHDAIWLVLKAAGKGETSPILIATEGHVLDGPVGGEVVSTEDGLGAFIQSGVMHRGDVQWSVSLALREALEQVPEVWATEMVFIPKGPFELGDDHPEARALGSFIQADGSGGAAGLFRVTRESAIEIGPKSGQLHYQSGPKPEYRGDGAGPLPSEYPKGVNAFYVMKYELRQGEYARFLNALPEEVRAARRPDRMPDETEERGSGSISLVAGRFVASAPRRPCNFVTWDDTCAYFDFLCLRPLSEFEFEKAARGPVRPVPLDFPWGTAQVDMLQRKVTADRDLAFSSAEDQASLVEATRALHGASYYGVMDLSGSLWERVVSAGTPAGRAFLGTHGDGLLNTSGDATNEDWPRGTKHAPGIGFRGGAEYFGDPSLTNPHSPVGLRTFAAYDGAHRYKTYSARVCRTAPIPR